MREIDAGLIEKTVAELCIRACTRLPDSLRGLIERSKTKEDSPQGKAIFDMMLENLELAEKTGLPICQDTGMAVIFIELGQDVRIIGGSFSEAINRGVAKGYETGYLRMSIVKDPLRRENTGNNTPALIYTDIKDGDRLKISVCPKGFGSENMSALKMFTPAAAREDIIDFITETAEKAGSNPCPPIIVGVGLGGTADSAMLEAKRALMREAGSPNPDSFYDLMEKEALAGINALGIGPQGLGGKVTALAVHITPLATHIAGLPCAINIGCHVTRHASAVL